jgi:hypothetical protein
MNFILSLLITFNLGGANDTLRHDGYYLFTGEQATHWKALYFHPGGNFGDTTGAGTPLVFEQGTLVEESEKNYSIREEKKTMILNLEAAGVTREYKIRLSKDEMMITAVRMPNGKWKEEKERYFFIPY